MAPLKKCFAFKIHSRIYFIFETCVTYYQIKTNIIHINLPTHTRTHIHTYKHNIAYRVIQTIFIHPITTIYQYI